MPVLIVISLVFNLLAMSLDYIIITQPPLKENHFDLFTTVQSLWQDQYKFFSFFTFMFCIFMPLLKWFFIVWYWFSQVPLSKIEARQSVVLGISKWSMIDVFGLGYAIFRISSDEIILTETRAGFWFLLFSFFINTALDILSTISVDK